MAHTHYYPNSKENTMLSLSPQILYTGIVKDDPNWFNIEHQHEFCEVLYVARGRGFAIIGSQEFALQEGDLIIINPLVLHQERSCQKDPLFLVFLGINEFQLNGLLKNFLIDPMHCPVISLTHYKRKVEDYFTDLIYETSSAIPFHQEMSQSLVNSLVMLILRILLSSKENEQTPLSKECQQVKDFIDRNYTQPLTLDTLSETVYISKHHLAHIFKNQTGTSPIKYIIEKRMESACQLLADSNLSVTEIAFQVGYQDPVYFSQLFKKCHGISPSAYRSQLLIDLK